MSIPCDAAAAEQGTRRKATKKQRSEELCFGHGRRMCTVARHGYTTRRHSTATSTVYGRRTSLKDWEARAVCDGLRLTPVQLKAAACRVPGGGLRRADATRAGRGGAGTWCAGTAASLGTSCRRRRASRRRSRSGCCAGRRPGTCVWWRVPGRTARGCAPRTTTPSRRPLR